MKSKSFHLKWSSHFPNMEKAFSGLVKSETLADVSLVCSDGQVLKSHRFILSSSSDFLHDLFIESSESQPVLFLPDVDPEVLHPLLHFIYTGEISLEDEELVGKMMVVSELLYIKGLSAAMEERQKRMVASENSLGSRRKTRSPRQVISSNVIHVEGTAVEGPRDFSRKEEIEVLRDHQENLPHNIIEEDLQPNSNYNENSSGPPPAKLLCLDEIGGGQAWASNHQIFSSILPKLEPDPLAMPSPRIKQEEHHIPFASPFPPLQHPPVNLNSEHISNILNTSTLPVCPLCGKDCANFPNLRTHLQTHNNSKPFSCDFCDSKFTRASHLNRHRRSHTGEKPFECSICGKLFSRQDKLKVHVDRHRIKEQKELKMNAVRQGQQQQQHLKGQQAVPSANNWSVNAAFPSQVSPYPSSYYDTLPKNQHSTTLMPSYMG